MKIFFFDENGLLTGSRETEKCEITGKDVFPNYSTDLEPPVTKEGEVAVFETPFPGIGISFQVPEAKWVIKKDLRGNYFNEINQKIYFDKIGEEPPATYTKEPKDTEGKVIDYESNCIREKTFEEKKTEINTKAHAEIISKYPEWKQLNVLRNKDYSEKTFQEYITMINFIDERRAYADYEVLLLEQ